MLFRSLLALNKDLRGELLRRRAEKVNDLQCKYSLTPSVSVVYRRYAFECDDLRITVDSNIEVDVLQKISREKALLLSSLPLWQKAHGLIEKYDPSKHCVLEVKHQGVIPEWANQLIKDLGTKKTSFSKYCWGIAREVNSTREVKATRAALS